MSEQGSGYYVDRERKEVLPCDPAGMQGAERHAMALAFREAARRCRARAATEQAVIDTIDPTGTQDWGTRGQEAWEALARRDTASDLAAVCEMLANQAAVNPAAVLS